MVIAWESWHKESRLTSCEWRKDEARLMSVLCFLQCYFWIWRTSICWEKIRYSCTYAQENWKMYIIQLTIKIQPWLVLGMISVRFVSHRVCHLWIWTADRWKDLYPRTWHQTDHSSRWFRKLEASSAGKLAHLLVMLTTLQLLLADNCY